MFVTIGDDVLRYSRCETSDVLEECITRSIHIDADAIHGILDFLIELLSEKLLIDIMLILSDTDRLRIDLGQLSECILCTMTDTDSTTDGDIERWIFFLSERTGTVDRRSCFGYYHVFGQEFILCDHFTDELFGFTRTCTVADDDDIDFILRYHIEE